MTDVEFRASPVLATPGRHDDVWERVAKITDRRRIAVARICVSQSCIKDVPSLGGALGPGRPLPSCRTLRDRVKQHAEKRFGQQPSDAMECGFLWSLLLVDLTLSWMRRNERIVGRTSRRVERVFSRVRYNLAEPGSVRSRTAHAIKL